MTKIQSSEATADSLSKLDLTESDDLLIIALDFGTTYSGIAYIFNTLGKPEPTTITNWPAAGGRNDPKIPTLLEYDKNDKTKFVWGKEVNRSSANKIEGVKLLLDPTQPVPLYVPAQNTKTALQKLGKSPIEVASDYIGAMYKHALQVIEDELPPGYMDMYQKKFVLSVPAVWSDKAKDSTLKAAKNAGIFPITMIKEPEAAALYTFHYLKNKALQVGDAFVICDAGGGTVDLISYEVTQQSPLELKELVPGTGGLAGSLMLNKRFEEYVKNIVGEEAFFALKKTPGYVDVIERFDSVIKPQFNGDQKQEWFVNFPMAKLEDDPENNLEGDCLTLKSDSVLSIFEPLIAAIEKLVAEQVNKVRLKRVSENHERGKEIKAIFLVGGFGSSQYLKKRLEKANPDIKVIQPQEAWAAIVRGAVMSQLPQEASITSLSAVRHYGVSANSYYKESEDLGQEKIWDRWELRWRVSKMTWYISKGEDLKKGHRLEFSFNRKLAADHSPASLIFEDDLIMCDEEIAPKYPERGVTKINCTLVSDLRNVPDLPFKHKTNADGEPYLEITYKLVMTMQTFGLTFGLEINGQEMGKLDANYA